MAKRLIERDTLFKELQSIVYNRQDAEGLYEAVEDIITDMPTTTEAEIRASAFSDLIEKIRENLELPPLALDYIRIFAEQLKEE